MLRHTFARTRCRPTPLSDRTYDRIFTRAQSRVEWAQRTPLTAHVLRYTAITAVERIAGFAVAQAFAGHQPSSVTGSYAKAGIGEVAEAVARLTGEEHPLASASQVVSDRERCGRDPSLIELTAPASGRGRVSYVADRRAARARLGARRSSHACRHR